MRGSANRSILVAARDIILEAPFVTVPIVILVVIVFAIGAVAVLSVIDFATPETKYFPDSRSPYTLDIVVMPFESATPDDPTCQSLADDLANDVAATLSNIFNTPTKDAGGVPSIQVWPPNQLRAEDVGGPAPYETKTSRMVVDLDADIALYGIVACNATHLTVTPRFFIGPSLFKDAPEFYGIYELGSFSSPINQPNDHQAVTDIKREIAQRASLMATLSEGFDYYSRDTYKNYLTAADVFDQIVSSPEPPNAEIMAIAHVFIGNAYLNASVGDCGNILNNGQLQIAEAHYQQALEYQPQMALAYLGLANSMKQRVIYLGGDDPNAIGKFLAETEELYGKAFSMAAHPSTANIQWKVQYEVALGRIQAKLIERDNTQDESRVNQLLDEASDMTHLLLAICESGSISGSAPHSATSFTYRLLGEIATQQEHYVEAQDHFHRAAEQATTQRDITSIAVKTADVMNELRDYCGAGEQYQIAFNNTICAIDRLEYATYARDYQIQCEMQVTDR